MVAASGAWDSWKSQRVWVPMRPSKNLSAFGISQRRSVGCWSFLSKTAELQLVDLLTLAVSTAITVPDYELTT